jgi:RHS repeat-associated protein
MSSGLFRIRPTIVVVCVLALLQPSLAWAVANDGYQGNAISGRPSIAIVDAPGGLKVNTLLGNVFLSRTDLRIPGRGLPIEIALTYNSNQNGIASPFGFGWRFGYDMKCLLSASRNVVVLWGDGRADLFKYQNGAYTPVNENVFAALQQVGNLLRLTTKEQIQFFFDTAQGLLQRIQDPNANAVTLGYTNSLLTSITDASGRKIFLAHDVNGRVTQVTDPNTSPARTLQYTYDASGNQTGLTDSLGNHTTYSYDAGHRLKQSVDPLGITDVTYGGPAMSVTQVSRATPGHVVLSTQSYTYDRSTTTTTVTDTLTANTQVSRSYQYDSRGRLIAETDPLGHVVGKTYDAAGNVASMTDQNGHATQFSYDARGNLLTTRDPLGNMTSYTYDPALNKITSATNPNGDTIRFTYDAHGNLSTSQDSLGNTTTYSYDGFGQPVARRNTRGSIKSYIYDSFGNLAAVTDPLGRTKTYTYDQAGRLVAKTDASHRTTVMAYDAMNRLTDTVYPDGTHVSMTYDSHGNLLRAVDRNTDTVFTYDSNGNLLQATDNLHSKAVSYGYDGLGRRTRMVDPEGAATSYGYDLAGRPIQIVRSGRQYNFTYDAAGWMLSRTLPNGVSTANSYDAANRLVSSVSRRTDNSVLSSYAYQYDRTGKRIGLTLANGDTVAYAYDADSQLVQETRSGATHYSHQFLYDAAGNRTRLNADNVITTYAYDAADELTQETTGAASVVYQYDANGNQITKTTSTDSSLYGYDFNDRLVNFQSGSHTAVYTLDVFGRRVNRTVDGNTVQYAYDGYEAIDEYDAHGALTTQNLFGQGLDVNLARFSGSQDLYYIQDGANSVAVIVDAAQSVQNLYDYDAWGNVLNKVENVQNRYGFAGRELDEESGLYDLRARQYNPTNGRFAQEDPLDAHTGRSLYTYVENNPISFGDPFGMWGWSWGDIWNGIKNAAKKVWNAVVKPIIKAVAAVLVAVAIIFLCLFLLCCTPFGIPVLIILAALAALVLEWIFDVLLILYFFLVWFIYFTWLGQRILEWLRNFNGRIPFFGTVMITAANGPGCIGTDGAYDSGSMAV